MYLVFRYFILGLIIILYKKISCLDCGVPAISPSVNSNDLNKILNGEPAIPNSWPWVVSLRFKISTNNYLHFCVGVLIDYDRVLTAAHCVLPYGTYQIYVIAGLNNLNENVDTQTNEFQVSEIYAHPEYLYSNLSKDIAVLKLTRKVTLSDKIRLICLPQSTDKFIIFGQNVTVVGWGTKLGRIENKNVLLQKKLVVLNKKDQNIISCGGLDSQNYCLLDPNEKQSSECWADPGGPLFYKTNDKWFVFGTLNVDASCIINVPLFSTIFPDLLDFINNKNIILTTSSIPKTPIINTSPILTKTTKKITTKKSTTKKSTTKKKPKI